MTTPATVHFTKAPSTSELAPMAVYDPTDVSILDAGVTAWWPGATGMVEGVAEGSELAFKWKSLVDLQAFTIATDGNPPIVGFDEAIGKSYLQFGYGGDLARRTLTAVGAHFAAAGSGYAVNDTVTFTGGLQIKVLQIGGGGAINTSDGANISAGYQILNYGTFGSAPTGVLTQTATSGSGGGATMVPEFKTECGSLVLTPKSAIVPDAMNLFSVIVVFRCPVVGGVAGSDPGGFIFGAQVNHSEVVSATANNRWWGLAIPPLHVGNYSGGELVGFLNGDSNYIEGGGHLDVRDGSWHVAMLTIKTGTQTCALWLDGAQIATQSLAALNGLASAKAFRIGATGLPGAPTGGAALDVGAVMVVPQDLNDDANEDVRTLILDRLAAVWQGA